MSRIVIATAALSALIACTPAAPEKTEPATPAATAALTASEGAPTSVQPAEVTDNLAWAASVVQLDNLTNEANGGVKLFGLAGGDPAMNGLHTHLSFYENPAEGNVVFSLGDFLSYRVLSEAPGRVDLEIRENTLTDGDIGTQTRYAIVTWTETADGAPTSITVTPAQAP